MYKYIKTLLVAVFISALYIFVPKILQMTCGFSVQNIHVVVDRKDCTRNKIGRNILNQLHKIYGSNTLCLSRDDVYKRICVKKLHKINVFKKYPNTIVVRAEKKKPLAVLQKEGKYYYIDDRGDIYYNAKTNKYNSIVITGESANLHAKEMIFVVRQNKFISQNIVAASFIDKRRWDLYIFDRSLKIMLPETFLHTNTSLKVLESIEKLFYALDKNKWNTIAYIDCRCDNLVIGL